MVSTSVESKLARLSVDVGSPVARIRLHNPPLNIIDVPMMGELGQALGEIEGRSDISVIVLSSEGRAFSAGVDVAAHTPGQSRGDAGQVPRRGSSSGRKPESDSVAAVHGHCLGGGAELAMVCDIVYTTVSAQWGFPEIKLACYPPVACTALAALVGQKRAAELILTGQTISGVEAAGDRAGESRCCR